MKKIFYRKRFILFPFIGLIFLSLISFIVMQLWNNLLPDILNVNTITFWQALGIFILSKILFGFGGGGRMGPWMHRGDRFRNMSDEERQAFREQMKNRMCWKAQDKESEPAKSMNEE